MDLQNRLISSEKAILFMQQEHAQTLKGLHQEIEHLQRRCSELTFKLAMHNTCAVVDDSFQKRRVDALEQQLRDEQRKALELQQQVEKRDRRVRLLEQQVKAKEKQFEQEIKGLKSEMNVLQIQLEQKSSMIAYLTTQLHQAKMQARPSSQTSKRNSNVRNMSSTSSPEGSSTDVAATSAFPKMSSPAPPHTPKPSRTPVRHSLLRQGKRANLQEQDSVRLKPSNPAVRNALGRESSTPLLAQSAPSSLPHTSRTTSPDLSSFLSHTQLNIRSPKPRRTSKSILPPIQSAQTANKSRDKSTGGAGVKKLIRQSGDNMQTLAVENVNGTKVKSTHSTPPTDASS